MSNRDGWSDGIPDWYITAWDAHMEDLNRIERNMVDDEYLDTIKELMKTPKVETITVEQEFTEEEWEQLQKLLDKLIAQYCNYEVDDE